RVVVRRIGDDRIESVVLIWKAHHGSLDDTGWAVGALLAVLDYSHYPLHSLVPRARPTSEGARLRVIPHVRNALAREGIANYLSASCPAGEGGIAISYPVDDQTQVGRDSSRKILVFACAEQVSMNDADLARQCGEQNLLACIEVPGPVSEAID